MKISRALQRLKTHVQSMILPNRILQRVDSSSSDEVFLECSSTDCKVVAREESIPKTNQLEERSLTKSNKNDSKPPSCDSEETVSTIEEACHDSGIIEIAGTVSVGTTMSSRDEIIPTSKEEFTSAQPSPVGSKADIILNSTFIGGEATPEKFKRYLHERNEDIERLGISFDSDDGDHDNTGDGVDDGYLPESDSDEQLLESVVRDLSNILDASNSPSFSSLKESVWEKISLLM